MAFLIDEDYKKQIKTGILEQVIRQDGTILTETERVAQSEIESYLRYKYDLAAVFISINRETPDQTQLLARNPQIVLIMVDIVLYHIHAAVSPQQMPDLRVKRYDDAIAWLKAVASGKLSPDLPILPVAETPTGGFMWGSQERVNNYY